MTLAPWVTHSYADCVPALSNLFVPLDNLVGTGRTPPTLGDPYRTIMANWRSSALNVRGTVTKLLAAVCNGQIVRWYTVAPLYSQLSDFYATFEVAVQALAARANGGPVTVLGVTQSDGSR